MEEIRMLSNIETEKHHLIQIILVGQPELRFKLQQSNLKQFAQRVTVHCHLKGLEKDEVSEYINHRLEIGGGDRVDIFDKGTIDKIAVYSRGIPRLINILCDSALVYGFADELETISTLILDNVYEELKTLGTFTDYDAKPSANPASPAAATAALGITDHHFQPLEGKIQLLDDKIANFKERLDYLAAKRTERDDILIELFKMLKENLDSRMQLLSRLDIVNNNFVKNEDDDHANSKNTSDSSKVSSLNKHKKKKK
jgi:general secretion pathway protein A